MPLVLILALLLVFELAAWRWGYDSRDDFSEGKRNSISTD
jgi:hypothetical protein